MDADLESFNRQLESFFKATEQAIAKTFREIVIEVGETVVSFSPVLTGLFKGNWQLTVGSPAAHSLTGVDPSGSATVAEIRSIASKLSQGDIAYIANNLTYGLNVETQGWEKTPPYMPVRKTVVEFKSICDAAIARNKVDR